MTIERNRHELRFKASEWDPAIFDQMEQISYKQPWVTTLYLGTPDGVLPKRATVKLRYFSAAPHTNTIIPPNNETGLFEVKVHPRDYTKPQRRKYKTEAKIGDILSLLRDRNRFDELSNLPLLGTTHQFPPGLLHALCEDHDMDGLIPVSATHYLRTHYVQGNVRATHDTHISLWHATQVYGIPVLRKQSDFEEDVVEVKQPLQLSDRSAALQLPQVSDAARSKSKLQHMIETLPGTLALHKPDIQSGTDEETEWTWHEREIKLDTTEDPREAVNTLASTKELTIAPMHPVDSEHQYIITDTHGICVKTAMPPKQGLTIKYKVPIRQGEDGVLECEERGLPYTPQNLQSAIAQIHTSPSSELPRSDIFTRHRARQVAVTTSGNVFFILGDHCVSRDSRAPLNQVEIEHIGYVNSSHRSPTQYATDLAADFQIVNTHVFAHLQQTGLNPTPSFQSKYEWATQITGQLSPDSPTRIEDEHRS